MSKTATRSLTHWTNQKTGKLVTPQELADLLEGEAVDESEVQEVLASYQSDGEIDWLDADTSYLSPVTAAVLVFEMDEDDDSVTDDQKKEIIAAEAERQGSKPLADLIRSMERVEINRNGCNEAGIHLCDNDEDFGFHIGISRW